METGALSSFDSAEENLNGNSCLHFAFGYGFADLGEYLIAKGADDSIQNINGLTCWEGLDLDVI
ncbi:hypothetical protein ACHAWO_006034 [Cyclotella atomus]|uniref:Uncharacterized protein n=1 Tax=Cyclotella atomus TaxID=382360 RepID=A0ABD3MWK0_9STRA